MVGVITSQHDPNFAREWWIKAQNFPSTILTKSEKVKLLEQEIKKLEKGNRGKAYRELQKDRDQWKDQTYSLVKFLKDEVGMKSVEGGRGLLAGKDLPTLLTELQEKENSIHKQITYITQLEDEVREVKDLTQEQIRQLEAKHKQELANFKSGKSVGTTHWIYWKKWADEQNIKLKKEVKKLKETETEYDKWKEGIRQFLVKYGIKSGKIADLGGLVDNLLERDRLVGKFLEKHKVKNLGELTNKVNALEKDNQTQATKIKEQEKQRKDGEKVFNELIEIIKPKTVIFVGKKKTKQKLTQLKTALGYDKTDTEGISEEEE